MVQTINDDGVEAARSGLFARKGKSETAATASPAGNPLIAYPPLTAETVRPAHRQVAGQQARVGPESSAAKISALVNVRQPEHSSLFSVSISWASTKYLHG